MFEFVGLTKEPHVQRVEHLIRLFRSSHLFGQEYQSLTNEIKVSSVLEGKIVSRMLAFQDYVEINNKSDRVIDRLNKYIRDKESEKEFLKESLVIKKNERFKIKQNIKTIEKHEPISEYSKELGESISKELNIIVDIPYEINQKLLRDWRALVAKHITSTNLKLDLIKKLSSKLPELESYREKLKANISELEKKKVSIRKNKNDLSKTKKKKFETNLNLKNSIREKKDNSIKKENIDWLLKVKEEYENYKKQVREENKRHKNVQTELSNYQISKIAIDNEIILLEKAIKDIQDDINNIEINYKAINEFDKCIGEWGEKDKTLKELKNSLKDSESELINLKGNLERKENELTKANKENVGFEKKLKELQKLQSDFQNILDSIGKHIMTNICPVCGTSHKSKEELLTKLEAQKGIQPKEIKKAMEQYESAKSKTKILEKEVEDLEIRIKSSLKEGEKKRKNISEIERQIKKYEEESISHGLTINLKDIIDDINLKRNKFIENLNAKKKYLNEKKSKWKSLQAESEKASKNQERLSREFQIVENKRKHIYSMIEMIEVEASNREISMDLEKAKALSKLNTLNDTIKDIENSLEIKNNENKAIQKEIDNLSDSISSLEIECRDLDIEISKLRKHIDEAENLISRLNLNHKVGVDELSSLKKDLRQRGIHLDSLQDEIINLEIVLDHMQSTALLSKLDKEIEKIERKIQDLIEEKNLLKHWMEYFSIIKNETTNLRNDALQDYTAKYGPLTSNIQRRLRAVYGFGDVKLKPSGEKIEVMVERKSEKHLPPGDYFSESQIQIIMLSLFLSAALTQNWSSFAPILLDDPVEHFDDLNAYSFIDLVRGLIMYSGREHQLIISTCDDRLYRLMRQRFSRIGQRVIFHVFESIGENGPKIKTSYSEGS